MNRALILLPSIYLVTMSPFESRALAAAPERIAIVVGANEASPGRRRLRYSHRDARATAAVLQSLGGFPSSQVHLMLDPDPDDVLKRLDAALKGARSRAETMLFFYYSGHADARALYPNGKPLSFSKLRSRLDNPKATIRVGVIDACRGGSWTGTKGLSEAAVFKVNLPLALNNEGSVLIASSSGVEDAHESESLKGSFFTHHWNAGLRGAADRNSDGKVTLGEAFAYAKARTIRDTAMHTASPQHPSFKFNLTGRADLSLSRVAAAHTVVEVAQQRGPLQLVHVESGVMVLELPRGRRRIKVAVAPGKYVVRRLAGAKVWAREIDVVANRITHVGENQLEVIGRQPLTSKGDTPSVARSTEHESIHSLAVSAGVAFQKMDLIQSDLAGVMLTFGYVLGRTHGLLVEPRLVLLFGDNHPAPELGLSLGYRLRLGSGPLTGGLRIAIAPGVGMTDETLFASFGAQIGAFAQYRRFLVQVPVEVAILLPADGKAVPSTTVALTFGVTF